jgi:hypothetical protein
MFSLVSWKPAGRKTPVPLASLLITYRPMYPADIRSMSHTIIFFAITCCGCSLASMEPRLEFATQNEYRNWIAEQAHIQVEKIFDDDVEPGPRAEFWRDLVVRSIGDQICEDLAEYLLRGGGSSVDIGFLEGSRTISFQGLRRLARARVLRRYRDLHAIDRWRQLQSIIKAFMSVKQSSVEGMCDSGWPWNSIINWIRYVLCILLTCAVICGHHSAEDLREMNEREKIDLILSFQPVVDYFGSLLTMKLWGSLLQHLVALGYENNWSNAKEILETKGVLSRLLESSR